MAAAIAIELIAAIEMKPETIDGETFLLPAICQCFAAMIVDGPIPISHPPAWQV